MKLSQRRWYVIIAGATIFLAAFGIAFAATWFQGSQVVPSALIVQTTVVISGDQMFALWRDEAMTEPVISGDGPHITFLKVETEPPRRQINFVRTPPIFIQNVSSTFARPIEPCHDVIIGGQLVGAVSAHLRTLGFTDQERGNTCDDGRIGEMMSPGEKWMIHINLELKQPLPEGGNFFDLVIGGIGVTGDVPTPIEPPAGMVSWWPGDGHAQDIVDGNHGTMSGDATATADGMVGQAFSFDGTGDFVNIPDNPNLDFTTAITIDAWIKRAPTGSVYVAQKRLLSDNSGYNLSVAGNGAVHGTVYGVFGHTSDRLIPTDVFTHVAWTYDSNAGLSMIYINGRLDSTFSSVVSISTNNEPLYIGRNRSSCCGTLSGTGFIDEVEIFNRALSAAEIRAIFEAGSAGKRKPQPVEPPAGMVSWWPGDGNASDLIDGNHGTLSGDANAAADGMVGQAFSFDGAGDHIAIPDSQNLDITDEITIEAWIHPATPINGYILSKQEDTGPSGAYSILVSDDVNGFDSRFNGTTFRSSFTHFNQWSHVASTYSSSAGEVKNYINGVLLDTFSHTGLISITNDPLQIGRRLPNNFFFNGLIDEVSIFNRALTEAEIKAIFEAGTAGKRKPVGIEPPAGMVSWWPGDGNASDIIDGNHGTLNGATFATGKVGQAFNFDGNDFVDTQANVGLTGAQARSIDLWVNIAADGGGLGAIPVGYGVAGTDQLFALAITKPGGGLSGGRNVFFSGFFNDLLGFMPISLNTWHHIAVTYDGTTLAIYVDGVLDASALKSLGTIDSVLSMGKAISGGWTPFKGLIDEVELFDRALSPAEIRAIFEAGSAGKRKP